MWPSVAACAIIYLATECQQMLPVLIAKCHRSVVRCDEAPVTSCDACRDARQFIGHNHSLNRSVLFIWQIMSPIILSFEVTFLSEMMISFTLSSFSQYHSIRVVSFYQMSKKRSVSSGDYLSIEEQIVNQ